MPLLRRLKMRLTPRQLPRDFVKKWAQVRGAAGVNQL